MDLVWVRLYQSGFRQGLSWLNVLFKHMQAISWVWCICFTVKNEQNWERDSNKYILLSLCLDETSLWRNWVWWLKEKDGEKEREGERALRHKAPVSRDSRQAFTCVFPTVCVCVRARVCSILMCRAERRMREEERKRKCVARGSVSPSILLRSWREDTACYFFNSSSNYEQD